jgi:hypothetical protein
VAYPGIFFGGGFRQEFFSGGGGGQQIQLTTEGRENGDLGAVAPYSGVPLNLQMSESLILVRLFWIYFPRISEFVSASEFRGGGGVCTPQTPPFGTPLVESCRLWPPYLTHDVNSFSDCLIQNTVSLHYEPAVFMFHLLPTLYNLSNRLCREITTSFLYYSE